jgi:hypothetical protein
MSNSDLADAASIRNFLESVVVWPGPNDPGWINMHVTVPDGLGSVGRVGWPFRDLDAFVGRARWTTSVSNFRSVWVCMSQQSECTTTKLGKPKAVTEVKNATWLRSIWIDCELRPKGRKHYRTLPDAWAAIIAFRQKVGLPFPSAVVKSAGSLQVYWISETPLTPDEWQAYAYGLSRLLQREGVKCSDKTYQSTALLPVPGTMSFCPPRLVELVHLGRRYDFSSTFSLLRNTATETWARARSAYACKTIVSSGDQT